MFRPLHSLVVQTFANLSITGARGAIVRYRIVNEFLELRDQEGTVLPGFDAVPSG